MPSSTPVPQGGRKTAVTTGTRTQTMVTILLLAAVATAAAIFSLGRYRQKVPYNLPYKIKPGYTVPGYTPPGYIPPGYKMPPGYKPLHS